MFSILRFMAMTCLVLVTEITFAQVSFKGKIIDSITGEPISGATVQCSCSDCRCGCTTNAAGEFTINNKNCCTDFQLSYIGYKTREISISSEDALFALMPDQSALQEVVVSANRQPVRRSEAPIAISNITSSIIRDAKPSTVDQVLNKVSGVYMANLGNEQHSMSIRQPITTKSLFLYLEDGIPIRTTGLFNHNALLEMNMAAVKNIEVIKGPSSSLYGSEAIGGVVNFITLAPTASPVVKLSAQANDIGYKRTDLQASFTKDKWGIAISGYYAERKNGFIDYSDFNKGTFTVRIDRQINQKTSISNSLTLMQYRSDMAGSIDSAKYYNRSFISSQTFTYRNVDALRTRSVITQNWSDKSKTTIGLVYRNNEIAQNPAYGIKNDRKKLPNGIWVGNKSLAHGEINSSNFESYAAYFQHAYKFLWKKAFITGGASVDISPTGYDARYIKIHIDTLTGKYVRYENPDSLLTYYNNKIHNYAAYLNFEFSPIEKLRVVSSLRYDRFNYDFDNHLKPSSFSGSPDTLNWFHALSPKIGCTYNFSSRTGFYANYSQGFVPPQVTEMYKGVKVPEIKPSTFYNYEVGGWAEIIKNKLTADISLYKLTGTNEIVSVRLDDGSTENRNTGKTLHKGIETGFNAIILNDLTIRFSAAYSKHMFIAFEEKGTDFSGKEMNGAPRWIHNAEIWYKPSYVKGLRLGLEWQKLSSYFMDAANTTKYKGFNAYHLRAGYERNGFEIWLKVMNLTDHYYAFTSSKSNSGYNYTPAEPRNFNAGISYDFANFLKNQ